MLSDVVIVDLVSITFLPYASTLGWVGAIGTVLAYALVSMRVLSATSRTFQAVNALGAALLTVSALAHDSWPSAASNLTWVLIALVALARSRRLAAAEAVEGVEAVVTDTQPQTRPDLVTSERHRDEVPVAA